MDPHEDSASPAGLARSHKAVFDVAALMAAVDRRRQVKGLSWRQVGAQTGLGYHLFLRMNNHARGLSVDALAVILLWLGDTDIAPYLLLHDTPPPPAPLRGAPADADHHRRVRPG